MLDPIYLLAIGYLVGSTPFSYWIVKSATGEDLRDHFSKNAGATNASRVLKKFMPEEKRGKAQVLHKTIFIMDVMKGAAAVMLMEKFGSTAEPWPIAAGVMAVIGHTFPLFLGFRGGKGVATCLGLIFGLLPLVALITFGVWVVVTLSTKFISVGSVVASVALHAAIYFCHGPEFFTKHKWTAIFLGILTLFIIIKHRSNLKRVLKGSEPKLGEKADE